VNPLAWASLFPTPRTLPALTPTPATPFLTGFLETLAKQGPELFHDVLVAHRLIFPLDRNDSRVMTFLEVRRLLESRLLDDSFGTFFLRFFLEGCFDGGGFLVAGGGFFFSDGLAGAGLFYFSSSSFPARSPQ